MFELDFRSRVPIYEQLVEKFKALIIANVLKADEQLPAVRVLAGELTVNPNTIQKAYRELEYQGFIYSVPGKGHFVIPVSKKQTQRLKKLKQEFTGIMTEMIYLGMTRQDIIDLVEEATAEDKGGCKTDD